jgi:signal transduction histidine kinase/ligand-binding sensor domain-containing protein
MVQTSVAMFLFVTSAVAATNKSAWSSRVWQSDDGLPNNNVTDLVQTPDGYLWVATPSRLARFDGNHFDEIYQSNLSPGYNQRITVLREGKDGSLWLPMDRGPVVHLQKGSVEIITNGLPNLVAEDAVEDGEGALWVSYRGGALRRVKNGRAYEFSEADGFAGARGGCALGTDNKGEFWFAQRGEVFHYHAGKFEFVVQLPDYATRLVAAREGGFWLCSGVELFRYDADHGLQEIGKLSPEPISTMATDLLEARDGAVWIATSSSGLFRYARGRTESIPVSHPEILSLLEDRDGNIWAGTAGGGLDRIQPRAIELLGEESGLPLETINSLCEDKSGTVWAVTQNGLLVNSTNGVWNTVSGESDWPRGYVTCVAADATGGVWAGGRSRIYHWHDGVWDVLTNGLATHIVRALLPASNGDLWVGGERLERFHNGAFVQAAIPTNVEIIRALAEDRNGNIWVGSANGFLLHVANGEAVDETARVLGERDSIRCLSTTVDGSLWIGFATDGLGRWKDGKFSRIGAAQGLGDESISQIVPDSLGWLWIGADHGIFKARQRELDALADGKIAQIQSIHYGRDQGLPSLQANFGECPGALKTCDGRVWIPLRSALACIDPGRLTENPGMPMVLLKRVLADDDVLATDGGLVPTGKVLDLEKMPAPPRLTPGHHRLEFEFTALNLSTPENMQFRYRLEGVDDTWVDGKNQRNVSYPGLTAGNYRFLVTARNKGAEWNATPASFAFSIQPFFWETWPFKISALAAFTIGVVVVGRYVSFRRLRRKVQALEQQAALEKERARIAKDIHDDVGGSLTQAALLLNLASQDQREPEKVGVHIRRAAATVTQVTESIDEIVWAADPRNDTLADLNDYISLFAVQFLQAANIRCRIDAPKHIPARSLSPEARHSLFLVVKEALNNVVRHANAREVRLLIVVTDESLKIEIKDDGRGFAAAPQDSGHDGLRNMRQRMDEIGGELHIESRPDLGASVSVVYFWRTQH